jgi:glycosyltransferase involved in cell wall biosynthesis
LKPLVSVVVPTLNAERYLEECLGALLAQEWPRDRLEILVADGGSDDRTLDIARSLGVDRILANPLKTGEAGKAVGVKAARGDLVCSVDSDNIVVGSDWLARMVAPFEDPEVVGAEVARFQYRRQDRLINRWHAMTGVADPLTLHVGNYCRDSLVTGRWTEFPHAAEPRDGWEKVRLDPSAVPVLGANGFIVRRSAFEILPVGDYHFDLDFVYELVRAGHDVFARVDAEVRHYFCDGVRQYARKQRRRVDDYFAFAASGERTYPWAARSRRGVASFAMSTALVAPLVQEALAGWRRRRDVAWLFHPLAAFITIWVYGTGTIRGRTRPQALDRTGWRQ